MRGYRGRRVASPFDELVHELVLLIDYQRFDHERGRDVGVPNRQRHPFVGVLAACWWMVCAAVDDGVGPAEPKYGEFVMHQLALPARHLVERGGKSTRPGGRVQRDGARRFGDATGLGRGSVAAGQIAPEGHCTDPDGLLHKGTRAEAPGRVEALGVDRGHLPIVEDEHVVAIDVQPGHAQRCRTSQHRPRSSRVGDHQDVSVGAPGERASLERPVSRPCGEHRLEPVLRRRLAGVVMGRGVVQDDPHPASGAQLEQRRTHVGLVEVMGEDVQCQSRIRSDFIEHLEDALAGSGSQPLVLLGIGEGVAVDVGPGDAAGVVEQLVRVRSNGGAGSEAPHERLRLQMTAGEPELELARRERAHFDLDGDGGRGIHREQRVLLREEPRRHHVDVHTQGRSSGLVHQAWYMHPPKPLDGGVDTGEGRLGVELRVGRRRRQPQVVVGIVGRPPRWPDLDGEAGKSLADTVADYVEGQQRLGVARVGIHGELSVGRPGERHDSTSFRHARPSTPGVLGRSSTMRPDAVCALEYPATRHSGGAAGGGRAALTVDGIE